MRKLVLCWFFITLIFTQTYAQTATEYYNSGIQKHEKGEFSQALVDFDKAIEMKGRLCRSLFCQSQSQNLVIVYEWRRN